MKYLFYFFFFITFNVVQAQQPDRFGDRDTTQTEAEKEKVENKISANKKKKLVPKKEDKWRFGGMFGASFGSYTSIEISPRAHYLITENFAVGGGVSYYYYKDNQNYGPGVFIPKREFNVYGANAFSWYNPFSILLLHTEFEMLNFDVYNRFEQDYRREWVPGLLLGGGIRQQSGNVNVFFVVLYNVLYDTQKSFYNSPYVLRIGVGF